MREPDAGPGADPTHVIVFATLGAARRRLLDRPSRAADPEPGAALVTTGRATVVSVTDPFRDGDAAERWLAQAGEDELSAGLAVLRRAIGAYRVIMADPHLPAVGRDALLVARVGYGAGEQVADGRWLKARELSPATRTRQSRARVLEPQARLAAALGGREQTLVCEELALRAQLDLTHGDTRQAALQLLVALDAAITELSLDPHSAALTDRIGELRERRTAVAAAAQSALGGALTPPETEAVRDALARIEAALRARAVAHA